MTFRQGKARSAEVSERASRAKRPFMLFGGGVRNLEPNSPLLGFPAEWAIPTGVTWSGAIEARKLPNFAGVVGQFGRPAANEAFHLADFVICVGSRLSTTVTGQATEELKGKIVHLDVDEEELLASKRKLNTLPIQIDLRGDDLQILGGISFPQLDMDWLGSVLQSFSDETNQLAGNFSKVRNGFMNSHLAVGFLLSFEGSNESHLVIDGGGTALYSGFQAAPLEKFKSVVSLNAISSMGSAPGQIIGVANATDTGKIFGVIGDGSLFMALNALPEIARNPRVVLIVLSNNGYLAIRHTQQRFLGGRFFGTWSDEADSLPEIEPIVKSMGFSYHRVMNPGDLEVAKDKMLGGNRETALVIEVFCDPNQPPFWSVSSQIDPDTGRANPLPLSQMAFGGLDA